MISLTKEQLEQIESHGAATYPHECGGLLIGRFEDGAKKVEALLPMENAAAESERHNRVLIPPKEVLRAERFARSNGLDVIGYYHSHPDWPAEPSQFDLDHALPVWSYIIVSVIDGEPVKSLSWEMRDDRSRFDPEAIEFIEI